MVFSQPFFLKNFLTHVCECTYKVNICTKGGATNLEFPYLRTPPPLQKLEHNKLKIHLLSIALI